MTKTTEELLLERIAKALEQIAANTDTTRHLLKDIRPMVYHLEVVANELRDRLLGRNPHNPISDHISSLDNGKSENP